MTIGQSRTTTRHAPPKTPRTGRPPAKMPSDVKRETYEFARDNPDLNFDQVGDKFHISAKHAQTQVHEYIALTGAPQLPRRPPGPAVGSSNTSRLESRIPPIEARKASMEEDAPRPWNDGKYHVPPPPKSNPCKAWLEEFRKRMNMKSNDLKVRTPA